MSTPLGPLSGNADPPSRSGSKKRKTSPDASSGEALVCTAPDPEAEDADAAHGAKRQRKEMQENGDLGRRVGVIDAPFRDSVVSQKLAECGVRCSRDQVLACSEAYSMPQKFEDALREPGSTEQFLEHLEEAFDKTNLLNIFLTPMADVETLENALRHSSNAAASHHEGGSSSPSSSSSSKFLGSSNMATSSFTSSYSANQDSVVRVLLKVDIPDFQQKIIGLLMNALCSRYNGDDDYEDAASAGNVKGGSALSSGVSFSTTVLQHLRWLDYVADSAALSQQLMDCIDVCPLKVQRDIILMIPEIVGDVELDELVDFLLAKMEECSSLTVAILDALTNLHLGEDTLESVRDRVIQQLQSSEIEVSGSEHPDSP